MYTEPLSPGSHISPRFNSFRALRMRSARANCTPDHFLPLSLDSGMDSTSPTCLPSTSSKAVPVSSNLAGVVEVTAWANLWESRTPVGFCHRFIKVVRRSVPSFLSGRRVAISRHSDKSVLSEKFQRSGSWEVMTVSRAKSFSIRERVCSHEGPVHTVAGRTRAKRPSPGLSRGEAVATKAAPSPAVADACLVFRRRDSSFWSFARSACGRLPNNMLPPTERVNGGFMMAKSKSGSFAVSSRGPLPVTFPVLLVISPSFLRG